MSLKLTLLSLSASPPVNSLYRVHNFNSYHNYDTSLDKSDDDDDDDDDVTPTSNAFNDMDKYLQTVSTPALSMFDSKGPPS